MFLSFFFGSWTSDSSFLTGPFMANVNHRLSSFISQRHSLHKSVPQEKCKEERVTPTLCAHYLVESIRITGGSIKLCAGIIRSLIFFAWIIHQPIIKKMNCTLASNLSFLIKVNEYLLESSATILLQLIKEVKCHLTRRTPFDRQMATTVKYLGSKCRTCNLWPTWQKAFT